MPERSLNLRVQSREFASGFVTQVVRMSDVVAGRSASDDVRTNAIRWKLGSTAAIQQAVLRSDPEMALADAWILCRQMKEFLGGEAGRTAFGNEQSATVTLATELESAIASLARRCLAPADFARMNVFVDTFVATHAIKSLAFERDSIALDWMRERPGDSSASVGTMAEAISDLSDRVSTMGQTIPMELRWRMDLERSELKPLAEEIRQLSLGANTALGRIPMLMESAQALTKAVGELPKTLAPEIARFDQQWTSTLTKLSVERAAIMESVQAERIAVVDALEKQRESVVRDFARERAEILTATDRAAQSAIERAGEQLRKLVATALALVIVLAVVVLGLPFYFGYLLGRTVAKRSPASSLEAIKNQ